MQSEKLSQDLQDALEAVSGRAAPGPALAAAMRKLARRSGGGASLLAPAVAALDAALTSLDEARLAIEEGLRAADHDPAELERSEERLFRLRAASRKFGVPVDTLAARRDAFAADLASIEAGAADLDALRRDLARAEAAYVEAARALSAGRHAAAATLDAAVRRELKPLRLERARLTTRVDTDEASRDAAGFDRVEFWAETNPGSRPGPLMKVASGGELSRFILALKVVLADRGSAPTLVFDEVDTGVGGAVSDAIGQRLARLGERVQVMAVTHAPQVAARADNHFLIAKRPVPEGDRVETTVSALAPRPSRGGDRPDARRRVGDRRGPRRRRSPAGRRLPVGSRHVGHVRPIGRNGMAASRIARAVTHALAACVWETVMASAKVLLFMVGAAFVGGAVASQVGPAYLASLLADDGSAAAPGPGQDAASGQAAARSKVADLATSPCQSVWPYQGRGCDAGQGAGSVVDPQGEAASRRVRVITTWRPAEPVSDETSSRVWTDPVKASGPMAANRVPPQTASEPDPAVALAAAKAQEARAEQERAAARDAEQKQARAKQEAERRDAESAAAVARLAAARDEGARLERERLTALAAGTREAGCGPHRDRPGGGRQSRRGARRRPGAGLSCTRGGHSGGARALCQDRRGPGPRAAAAPRGRQDRGGARRGGPSLRGSSAGST